MAEFTKTTTYTLACPACDSDRVVKDGFQKGTQRYECKNCKKKFRANGKGHWPPDGRGDDGVGDPRLLHGEVLQANS